MAISSTWRSAPPAPCAVTRFTTGVITVAIVRRTSCAVAIRPPKSSASGSVAPDAFTLPAEQYRPPAYVALSASWVTLTPGEPQVSSRIRAASVEKSRAAVLSTSERQRARKAAANERQPQRAERAIYMVASGGVLSSASEHNKSHERSEQSIQR